MIEYYNLLKTASDFISIKDLYNLYIKDDSLYNIYGNYETFANDEFIKGLINTTKELKIDENKMRSYLVIICKKKLFIYIKDKIEYFIKCYKRKKDLNFWLRLKISFLYAQRYVRRINFVTNLFDYIKHEEKANRRLKYLFATKQTNNIYVYALRKDTYLNYKLELKYKK